MNNDEYDKLKIGTRFRLLFSNKFTYIFVGKLGSDYLARIEGQEYLDLHKFSPLYDSIVIIEESNNDNVNK